MTPGDEPTVSVISTVFNEVAGIERMIRALFDQTRRPDEIVICDAGSTDGTLEILERLRVEDPILRVVQAPGNRSAGRNTAIQAASGSIIACTDAGCVADSNWLESLTRPFSEGARFVGGFYRPAGRTALSTAIGLVMVYVLEEAKQPGFIPSARSAAFERSVFELVGGFPEEVEFAEDTLFMERVAAAGVPSVLALDATVAWEPPATLAQLARTAYVWGRGDGEAGLRGWVFKRLLGIYVLVPVAVAVMGFVTPWAPVAAVAVPILDGLRRTRHKYRWAARPVAVLIPLAHLVSTYASLAGFLAGRRRRMARG
jgi:glycosyltransferase involved in cell wall biosynthesis